MDTLQLKASWKEVASVLKWQVEERFHVILMRMAMGICKQGKKGFLAKTTGSCEYDSLAKWNAWLRKIPNFGRMKLVFI